jgi:hypothetical protein
MNNSQLWTTPRRPTRIPPQAFVAAGLLAALLLGTSTWQMADEQVSENSRTFSATNSR